MNLFDVIDIKIPVDDTGTMKQVKRITDKTVGSSTYNEVLWEVPYRTTTYLDNIPVTLAYDIGDNSITQTISDGITDDVMYLVRIGAIQETADVIKGFSSYNYVRTPIAIDWTPTNSFEMTFKLRTGSNVYTRQEIFSMTSTESMELEILNGRIHWELAGKYSSAYLSTNTDYWIKFKKNNTIITISYSKNGSDYTEILTSVCNKTVTNEYMHFGVDKVAGGVVIEPFLGEFDLSQWSILYGKTRYRVKMLNDNEITLIRDGKITVTNQIISNFTSSNYAHTPFFIDWSTTNETTLYVKITTGADVNTRQEIFGMQASDNFELEIYNGALHWELTNTWSKNSIKANTTYYVEFSKKKTKYSITMYDTNNNIVASINNVSSSRTCTNLYLYLGVDKLNNGIEAFKGTIDCKESYLIYNDKKYKFKI